MKFFDIYSEQLTNKFNTLSCMNKRKLAIMSVERQFKYYSRMVKNRPFDKSKEYRAILDACWRFILFNEKLDENLWYQQDKLHIEKFNDVYYDDSIDDAAMLCITCDNIMMLIEMLEDPEDDTEDGFLALNIDYIFGYLNNINGDKYSDIDDCENHFLTINELHHQEDDFKIVDNINTLEDVREWLKTCKSII